MPKSVGYWKEIENVSQPLTFSPGQEVQVQDLASPVPNVIYQQKAVCIHYTKITKHRITGNPYLFPAVTSTAVKNCLSH